MFRVNKMLSLVDAIDVIRYVRSSPKRVTYTLFCTSLYVCRNPNLLHVARVECDNAIHLFGVAN